MYNQNIYCVELDKQGKGFFIKVYMFSEVGIKFEVCILRFGKFLFYFLNKDSFMEY